MFYLITGGERSGKSGYGQDLAMSLSKNPMYVATARNWDGDFQKRIDRHQKDRDENWVNIEKEKQLSEIDFSGKVALIDCVTLWLTNFFAFDVLKTDDKMAKKVEEGIIDFEARKAILILDIQKTLRKKLKKGRSLYIPLTKKNKAEIKAMIEADFGTQMKEKVG